MEGAAPSIWSNPGWSWPLARPPSLPFRCLWDDCDDIRASCWCSGGQMLYDAHTFTLLMKLAPSWTLYYWISLYVVWDSQRRTKQTSCSYWLQFDCLFTRLLLSFRSSLPWGQNWLYCAAHCCLQHKWDGDGAGKMQLQVRGTNESTERPPWWTRPILHQNIDQWATLLACKGCGVMQVTCECDRSALLLYQQGGP